MVVRQGVDGAFRKFIRILKAENSFIHIGITFTCVTFRITEINRVGMADSRSAGKDDEGCNGIFGARVRDNVGAFVIPDADDCADGM